MTSRKRSASEANENTPLQPLRYLHSGEQPTTPSPYCNNDSFQFINSSSPFRVTESFHTHTPLANFNSLSFIDGFTPVQKKMKLTRQFTAENILNSGDSHMVQDQAEDERRKETERMQSEEKDRQRKDDEQRLNEVLKFVERVGWLSHPL